EQHHNYFEVREEARDGSGSSPMAAQVFRADLRDPIIDLEAFYTNPDEPEESVRSEVHFDLAGDVDMVSNAVISVDRIKMGVTDVTNHYNTSTGKVFASFINPKIKDITLQDEIPPIRMKALLSVTYGFGYTKVFEEAYDLYIDRTPPTLEIVSPAHGDFVAIGERTDVILKAFDKYGIETVELNYNSSGWQALTDPKRYSFEASVNDLENGITIAARATDPNGNVSPTQAVTLFPYDA